MNLFSPLCRGPAGDIKAKMLSCVSGLSMYCTSGVFFKQKKVKRSFPVLKRKSLDTTKKNLNWTSFGVAQVYLFSIKQDSKELSPRPLENAPKTFNSKKKNYKLLMLKG